MPDLLMTTLFLAEERGLDPNIVKPGWLALAIVAALGLAVFFLSRSFIKHTRRAAQPWEGDAPEAPARDEQPRSRPVD